jgi:hypothetical protein
MPTEQIMPGPFESEAPDLSPPTPGSIRTFSLNSPEAYQALCEPRARPWIPNGSLPREPRLRDPEVIVERSSRR